MSKADTASAQVEAEASVEAEDTSSVELEADASQVSILVGIIDRAEGIVGKVWTALGVHIDHGAYLKAEAGESWTDWAAGIVPRSFAIVYKVRQAGAVARVLNLDVPTMDEADGVSEAGTKLAHLPGYLTLLPAYRLIKEARAVKDAGERAKAQHKAEADIQRVWARLTQDGTLPTQDEAEKAFARFGVQASSEDESNEPSNRNEPTDPAGDASSTVEVTLDTAGLESLLTDFSSQVHKWQEDLGVSEDACRIIALGTLRFGAERGYGNLTRVLS